MIQKPVWVHHLLGHFLPKSSPQSLYDPCAELLIHSVVLRNSLILKNVKNSIFIQSNMTVGNVNIQNPNQILATSETWIEFKGLCSCICLRSFLLKVKTKLNLNCLILKVCHFTWLQWSQSAFNTHTHTCISYINMQCSSEGSFSQKHN